MPNWFPAPLLIGRVHGEMCMADLVALEERHSEKQGRRPTMESTSAFSESLDHQRQGQASVRGDGEQGDCVP